MKSQYKFSIIIASYNPGDKIIHCLKSIEKSVNFFLGKSNLVYEILVINDGGKEINLNFDHKLKNLKQVKLKKIGALVTLVNMEQKYLNMINFFL